MNKPQYKLQIQAEIWLKKERLVSTFNSSFAVNTRLSENGYKAIRFHLQILHQLNIENKFSLSQKNDTQVKTKKKRAWGPTCQTVSNFVPSGIENFPDLSWRIW